MDHPSLDRRVPGPVVPLLSRLRALEGSQPQAEREVLQARIPRGRFDRHDQPVSELPFAGYSRAK